MVERLLKFLIRWTWIIKDKCEYCGGELEHWDTKRAYCVDCKTKQ